MFLGCQNEKITFIAETREELENLPLVILDKIEETQEVYELYMGEYLTPAEIEVKKQDEIKKLKVTKRVFALALQQFGITYMQLKELIATNDQAQLEWDLCVELERSNPLLDVMASQMGVTSAQLDEIFIEADKAEKENKRENIHAEDLSKESSLGA